MDSMRSTDLGRQSLEYLRENFRTFLVAGLLLAATLGGDGPPQSPSVNLEVEFACEVKATAQIVSDKYTQRAEAARHLEAS